MDLFAPKVAYAAGRLDTFIQHVNKFIINPLILFLFALALVFFLYGMFEFIMNASNEEKRATGKSHMLWGIVGLTVMMGVWFLLGVVLDTFNIRGIDPENGKVTLPDYNP